MQPPTHRPHHLRLRVRSVPFHVRLVGWARTPIVSSLLALASLGAWGCQQGKTKHAAPTPSESATNEPARGTEVVFEKVAGEFFEGTVLERNADRLRVQTHDGQATLNLTAAGVYPLGKRQPEIAPGSFAVCGTAPRIWQGCKVERSQAAQLSVLTLDGKTHSLDKARVLKLSSLSQMNVQRAFERAHKRQAFEAALTRAGAPVAPADWKPHAGERVVALRKGEWHTAHINEFEKDGAIRVRWRSDGEIERLERADIIPEPPYRQSIERGDFALLRPKAESRAWIAVKVRSVGTEEAEFKVQDVNDQIYEVGATSLVPLTLH